MSALPTPDPAAELPADLVMIFRKGDDGTTTWWDVHRSDAKLGQVFRTPDGVGWEGCRQLSAGTWQMVSPRRTWAEVIGRLIELAAGPSPLA